MAYNTIHYIIFQIFIPILLPFQNNSFPERGMIYDFCFEKRASGNWIDWMDTIDKQASAIPAAAKVRSRFSSYSLSPLTLTLICYSFNL